ncbi:tyrosine-type recombinase/integrase [Desulfofundulus salinus]|uniref:tyrosine-type recombinase/integrase n=1 Tax=Desulfofundulus salinus TaxID=2419843 RepID=UPI001FAA8DD5|nr:tyrosine-type recombinase/integrase [Desulfofundulus salinum]
MQEFLNTLDGSTARAYREDLTDFARWFAHTNGQDPTPELVTGIDLREYQGHMLAVRGLKPATVNRRLAAVRAWLRWARENGIIEDLPSFPRRAAEPKGAPRALSRVEEARFLRAVEREGSPRDQALIALMLHAGLRVGEAVRTRTADVEISERKGKVVVRAGKGMKRREVPLSAEARAMIRPWLSQARGEWLFPGLGDKHLSTRAAQDVVKKYAYLARLDVEHVTPHVLRHTFATRLLRQGVDIVVVAALLGHARIDTTARYTRPGWADLERAVEGLHESVNKGGVSNA